MKTKFLLVWQSLFLVALSGCGGGNSSSTSDAAITPEVFTGVFTDSPVNNLAFKTATQSGLTNTAGEFQYQTGETVEFSVGGITLGSAFASTELSPLNLAGFTTLNEARENSAEDGIVNRVLFLQSLDRDQNPNNGIDLEGLETALAAETLDFSDPDFLQGNYRRIVNQNNGYFVSKTNALNHLLETLQQAVTVSLLSKESIDTDGDGTIDQVINLSYNDQGQLIAKVATDTSTGTSSLLQERSYDGNGNLISIATGTTVESFEYHPSFGVSNHVTSSEGTVLFSAETSFDSIGNVTSLTTLVNFEFLLKLPAGSQSLPFGGSDGLPAPGYSLVSTIDKLQSNLDEIVADGTLRPTGDPLIILTPTFPILTTTISNTFDDQGNITQTILTSSRDETSSTATSNTFTSNIVYDGLRPVSISISDSISPMLTEIALSYDDEGAFTGCERLFDQSPTATDTFFFAPTNPSSLIPGNSIDAQNLNSLITCSEFVAYNVQGRITRIDQPSAPFSQGYSKKIQYTGDLVSQTTLTINSDPVQEQVRSFAHSTTGQLVEASITINGELSFVRELEYTSFTFDQLPQQ